MTIKERVPASFCAHGVKLVLNAAYRGVVPSPFHDKHRTESDQASGDRIEDEDREEILESQSAT